MQGVGVRSVFERHLAHDARQEGHADLNIVISIAQTGRTRRAYEETVTHLPEVHGTTRVKVNLGVDFCDKIESQVDTQLQKVTYR